MASTVTGPMGGAHRPTILASCSGGAGRGVSDTALHSTMLAESIGCTPGTDDRGHLRWYYRWSWGEVLHDTDDPSAAAAKIAEVLASR